MHDLFRFLEPPFSSRWRADDRYPTAWNRSRIRARGAHRSSPRHRSAAGSRSRWWPLRLDRAVTRRSTGAGEPGCRPRSAHRFDRGDSGRSARQCRWVPPGQERLDAGRTSALGDARGGDRSGPAAGRHGGWHQPSSGRRRSRRWPPARVADRFAAVLAVVADATVDQRLLRRFVQANVRVLADRPVGAR